MEDSCIVCYELFNKSSRTETKCPYCNCKICRTCLQTYLLNDISDIPHCVNTECDKGWDREFLDPELTRTFRLVTYKDHREKVLMDREKARMPSTQEDASLYKEATIIHKNASVRQFELENQIKELQASLDLILMQKYNARRLIDSYGRNRITESVAGATKAEPAKFIKPCPAEGCKGFLSTAWKCGLCAQWTCPDCHDLKGLERDVEHTCEPAKVETARLITKEAKPCPKCGVSICKIDGCDQMFCTICTTSFNWRTGRIAEGPTHNPHYFDWLRKQNKVANAGAGVAPPIGMNCDDRDTDRRIISKLGDYYNPRRPLPIRSFDGSFDKLFLIEAWRLMREYQDVNANYLQDSNEKYRQLRVRYMANEISEDEWKSALQRHEKEVNYQRAINQMKEVYRNATRDIIRQILDSHTKIEDVVKQMEELIKYCNESFHTISKRFGRKAIFITAKRKEPACEPVT